MSRSSELGGPNHEEKRMNAPARVTLISHATTSAVRRAAFPSDESIEDAVRERIRNIHWKSERAQHVYSGPEKRAQETALALGLAAAVDPALRDCNYGKWAGRELKELQREHPEEVALWLSAPDAVPHCGESIRNLVARVSAWLGERTKSGYTIAVTHPAVVRGIIVSILGAPVEAFWRIDIVPLTLTDIRSSGRSWTLRSTGTPLDSNGPA